MAIGNYIVSPGPSNDDIVFSPDPSFTGNPSTDQQDLIFNVESTLEVVNALYFTKKPPVFANYFDHLLKLSQVGLVGPNCQPQLAKRALDQIRAEITNRESGATKNNYLKKLGSRAVYLGAPALLSAALITFMIFRKWDLSFIDTILTTHLLLVWSGCMAGVWLSFTITRPVIGFDDLLIIEKDGLEPLIRLLFTGLLAIIFALLFIKGALTISLGQVSSAAVNKDAITAFLIGVILGLNEKIIGGTLTKKTSALFDNIK